MTIRKLDYIIFCILITVSAFLLFYISLYSQVHYEGSESIYHYFHSKAIINHPEILVNHWGKPLFIALSSPFAFFGERGVMIFNSLVMLSSAIIAFKLGRKVGFKFSFPLAVLVIFPPVYYGFAQSCLTEPLFGLVAISGAYLFLIERYKWSALVISFILFSRSEGMMFIPIYAIALIIRKQYWSLPYLLFGFIFYGIVGMLVGKGFLWYYSDYPYRAKVDFYGTGPFWHYFTNQHHITGTPFSILLIFSLVLVIINYSVDALKSIPRHWILLILWGVLSYFKVKFMFVLAFSLIYLGLKNFKLKKLVFLGLIVLPALIYVFGHSYLWYKGLSASVGLYRIVGGVIPLLAVLAMYGLNKFTTVFPAWKYNKIASVTFLLLFCFWMVSYTFNKKDSIFLIQPQQKDLLINESIDWIEANQLSERTMYVFQAHYISHFDGDHFDRGSSLIKAGVDYKKPEQELHSGDLLIWDGHISPNEGRLPVSLLDSNSQFKELVTFRPQEEFKVLGGGYYFIRIFERK